MIGSAHIIRGNALHLPLPDSSVDLICTSPPYFSLRSYQDAGAHYEGQIGSEATPADPFGGTGTTALVAKALGRTGITIDLSADYCRLAEWRCNNPQQLAQALQVEKPDVIPAGQLSLFEDRPEPLPVNRFHVNPRGRDCQACGYRSHYANITNCEKCGAPRKEPV